MSTKSIESSNTIVTVIQDGRFLKATTQEGIDISNQIDRSLRRTAAALNKHIIFNEKSRCWELAKTDSSIASVAATLDAPEVVESSTEHSAVIDFVRNSPSLKPKELFMSDLKWKYLVRSALRGKNIMMVGPAGAGKTIASKYLVRALSRPDFYFNLGSTQDPRSTLIGNTHFNKDTGTYFAESMFVKAIQTENAVILLDELSRAHPEAWNILMTVLDTNQRYLRLDEKDGSPTIEVANGVCFIATANIGNEYTATRVIDRAILDRFVTIEMEPLGVDEEFNLLRAKFPNANFKALQAIAEIADATRKELRQTNPNLTTSISTRASVEMAGLVEDGFTLAEAAEVAIYPFFSEDGGMESERVYVKQIVQKYAVDIPVAGAARKPLFGAPDIIS